MVSWPYRPTYGPASTPTPDIEHRQWTHLKALLQTNRPPHSKQPDQAHAKLNILDPLLLPLPQLRTALSCHRLAMPGRRGGSISALAHSDSGEDVVLGFAESGVAGICSRIEGAAFVVVLLGVRRAAWAICVCVAFQCWLCGLGRWRWFLKG